MPPTMQKSSHRPWLDLYRGVRPELTPASDTALAMFRATLARNADAPLVYYFERSLSGADCDAMSDALAVGLQERGVEAGDRVAVYLQNVPQFPFGSSEWEQDCGNQYSHCRAQRCFD